MTWSDIVSNNLSTDDQIHSDIFQMSNECKMYLVSLIPHTQKLINSRIVDKNIRYSGTGSCTCEYIDTYRKRKIPKKKQKTYSVKPKLPYNKENKVHPYI